MTYDSITLAIADDHRVFRQALKNALSQQQLFSIEFEADNGKHLLSSLSKIFVDVLLLDIKMPEMNGIDTLKIIHEKFPSIRVLILSAFYDEAYVSQSLEYGVNGYLTKEMDILDIKNAILAAYKNEVYLTNLLSQANLKKYALRYNKNVTGFLPEFTNEEIKILELLQVEKTTDEIAHIMNIGRRSVEVKRDKMKEKANVKTIGGLLLYSIKRGLIQ